MKLLDCPTAQVPAVNDDGKSSSQSTQLVPVTSLLWNRGDRVDLESKPMCEPDLNGRARRSRCRKKFHVYNVEFVPCTDITLITSYFYDAFLRGPRGFQHVP